MKKVILISAVCMLLAACSPKGLYEWGSYEESIYHLYNGENVQIEEDIIELSEELEEAQSENKEVGPGIFAHLGYLHYLSGNASEARQLFMAEKKAFPESAVFMDRLIGGGK